MPPYCAIVYRSPIISPKTLVQLVHCSAPYRKKLKQKEEEYVCSHSTSTEDFSDIQLDLDKFPWSKAIY